jgi:transcription termination factor Rho
MHTHTGILEINNKADGRLRLLDKTLVAGPADPVVPAKLIERYGMRTGLLLETELGQTMGGGNNNNKGQHQHHQHQQQGKKNKYNAVAPNAQRVNQIFSIDGLRPDDFVKRRRFEDLTSIDPTPRLTLEYPGCPPSCRLIDLFCPIGYGQRGMIVSPPKAGKTILLQNIAFAIQRNHPQVEVIALLIDERPEEVTDFRRNVPCNVLASSNDHTPEKHVGLAVLAIERAKRMTEAGKDVVILLDSLTRVGRAFNTAPGVFNTGRTLSGGLDASALAVPKQLFGAARRFEEGGSLTIIATALVDTGSRGDQVIFEEFKGTGNMELILDRKIAERRLFPAIDLAASGTRKEHLLLTPAELQTMAALRRRLLNMQPPQQVEQLLKALDRFKTNAELVGSPQSPASAQSTVRV